MSDSPEPPPRDHPPPGAIGTERSQRAEKAKESTEGLGVLSPQLEPPGGGPPIQFGASDKVSVETSAGWRHGGLPPDCPALDPGPTSVLAPPGRRPSLRGDRGPETRQRGAAPGPCRGGKWWGWVGRACFCGLGRLPCPAAFCFQVKSSGSLLAALVAAPAAPSIRLQTSWQQSGIKGVSFWEDPLWPGEQLSLSAYLPASHKEGFHPLGTLKPPFPRRVTSGKALAVLGLHCVSTDGAALEEPPHSFC